VNSLGGAGMLLIFIARPWMGLAAFFPSEAVPFAYRYAFCTGASVCLATAWGQGIHTMGADGQEWLPCCDTAHFHHAPSTEFRSLSGIALHS